MRRTDDVSLWSWPFDLGVTAIVGLTRLGILSEYQVQISYYGPHGSDISYDLVTLSFNLGGHVACRWCESTSSIRTPTLKFLGLTVRKIWNNLCVRINWPMTRPLIFWPWNWWQCSTCHGIPSCHFSDTTKKLYSPYFIGSYIKEIRRRKLN